MSAVPRAVGAIEEVLSTTAGTDGPEHMAAVMVTLPVRVQVGMLKAVMWGCSFEMPCAPASETWLV